MRFIPACAGNTGQYVAALSDQSVHPRVCGEHRVHLHLKLDSSGSSPRVRGTRNFAEHEVQLFRFIPACAGNTLRHRARCSARSVHPRVCGEHNWRATATASGNGSSPRVRGTPKFFGKPCLFQAVHPRVCGEHNVVTSCHGLCPGSSPRVRGTPPRSEPRQRLFRFIPACAGNTYSDRLCISRPAVHPRVCGEHPPRSGRPSSGSGSSPRVRGTLLPEELRQIVSRFIPACAGNTQTP